MKQHNFSADAFVSRSYRCAIILEEHLNELNDTNVNKKVNDILRRYNQFFTDLRVIKSKTFYGEYLINVFYKNIEEKNLPVLVQTLLKNVVWTKYKMEIIKK